MQSTNQTNQISQQPSVLNSSKAIDSAVNQWANDSWAMTNQPENFSLKVILEAKEIGELLKAFGFNIENSEEAGNEIIEALSTDGKSPTMLNVYTLLIGSDNDLEDLSEDDIENIMSILDTDKIDTTGLFAAAAAAIARGNPTTEYEAGENKTGEDVGTQEATSPAQTLNSNSNLDDISSKDLFDAFKNYKKHEATGMNNDTKMKVKIADELYKRLSTLEKDGDYEKALETFLDKLSENDFDINDESNYQLLAMLITRDATEVRKGRRKDARRGNKLEDLMSVVAKNIKGLGGGNSEKNLEVQFVKYVGEAVDHAGGQGRSGTFSNISFRKLDEFVDTKRAEKEFNKATKDGDKRKSNRDTLNNDYLNNDGQKDFFRRG